MPAVISNALSEFFHFLGFGLCHQIPVRSFAAGSVQFPVCARDTGMYLGVVVGLLVIYIFYRPKKPSEFPPLPVLAIFALLFLTLVFDGVTSYMGLRESSNTLRLFTGLCTGYAIAGILAPIMFDSVFRDPVREKLLATPASVTIWLVSLGIFFVIALWVLPLTGIVYALFSAASIIFTFMLLNLVMLCTVSQRFANSVSSFKTALIPVLISSVFALVELTILFLIKSVLS